MTDAEARAELATIKLENRLLKLLADLHSGDLSALDVILAAQKDVTVRIDALDAAFGWRA